MGPLGTLLAGTFYAVMFAAVAFFLHRLLWFLQYRRLQQRMVTRALEKLTEQADTTVVRWDRGADASWSEARTGDSAPSDYVNRVEESLASLEKELTTSHTSIRDTVVSHVIEDKEAQVVTLLTIPRRDGPARHIQLELRFGNVPDPEFPDESLFELELRSRYGFRRRLLAFFLGAADVVYSSQHMTRMAQNPKVPVGVLLRRLLLVLVIIVALGVDIWFGIRAHLVTWCEAWVPRVFELKEGAIADTLPAAVAMGIWLAAYGGFYVGLYVFLRWRSGRHLADLERFRLTFRERIADIRDQHLHELQRWAHEYGGTLDDAALMSMHQAQMLIERSVHRLRRRIASPRLLDLAGELAACFFRQLPEAAKSLQDVATTKKHTVGHMIWPRREEMSYQVEIAQYRHAWRDIEMCLSSLRGQNPDPDLANQLWRSLVRYARMFPSIVPEDLFARLQEAHGDTVATLADLTTEDLTDLDDRLTELADALQHTVESAPQLVETRIELTTRSMQATVAELSAEALRLRERARLEAMAFEI